MVGQLMPSEVQVQIIFSACGDSRNEHSQSIKIPLVFTDVVAF